jgi:CubicO group peptidase (beta-lactamase class C family)
MTPRRFVPIALAALALTAAACSDDGTVASTTNVTVAPSSSSVAPTTTDPATTVASSTTRSDDDFDRDAAIEASRALFADVDPNGPGCTVAVMRDGEVWAEAFGLADVEAGVAMTPETIVDIGSTSKQFTATAIGLLEIDGLVFSTAPVSTYLDGLPDWADEVTIDQLVHHTSGIPDYIGLLVGEGIDTTDPAGDAETLAALATSELDFEPGERFEYSNSNYFLLAEIVESVTGDDLGVFLAERVFMPLDLDAVMDPTAELDGVAQSYELEGDELVDADSPWTQLGDGAIRTTPTQLVRWAAQYTDPTIGGDELQQLRFEGATDVSAEFGIPGARYGYGIVEAELAGTRVLTHSGGWGGFVTTFFVAPDLGVAAAGTCTSPAVAPADGDPGFDLIGIWS